MLETDTNRKEYGNSSGYRGYFVPLNYIMKKMTSIIQNILSEFLIKNKKSLCLNVSNILNYIVLNKY